jgi:endogenous inhibitor of DNA gyrase (YacG/DUF329 family)
MTTDRIDPPGPATVIDCPWCAAPVELPTAALAVSGTVPLPCPACGTTLVLAGDDGGRRLPIAA